MALENIRYNEVIHKKLKKCEYCGRELTPIGLDYLYANFSLDNIEYERCTCRKAQEYWKEKDEQDYESAKRKHFREVINKIYKHSQCTGTNKHRNHSPLAEIICIIII